MNDQDDSQNLASNPNPVQKSEVKLTKKTNGTNQI